MRRPDEVKVGPFTYTIEYDQDLEHWGECRHNSLRILLACELGEARLKQTLLHEILHCCMFEAQGTHDPPKMSAEAAVTAIESAFFGALMDNPEVFKWIAS